MSISIAPQLHEIAIGETRAVAVDCIGKLESNSPEELLTGTPTIVEVTTSVLTLASKAVSTAALTINGSTVAIGKAVQFTCAPGASAVVGKTYLIKITVGTDSSQTVIGHVKVKVL